MTLDYLREKRKVFMLKFKIGQKIKLLLKMYKLA